MCFALDLIRFWLFLQVVKLSNLDVHTCCSSTTVKGREATINWLSRRSKDIVKEDPSLSAKKLQKRLQKQYNVDLSYWKVWSAKKSTMNDLHGTWEEGFTMLWRFKAALEESCPGSIVEIDCKKIDGKCTSQGCLCASELVPMVFWLGADHILASIPLTSHENIRDNRLQQLQLTDTTECIMLSMQFSSKKQMPTGLGSWAI